MGSGHGWATGWSVAWNCVANNYIIQKSPGADNWMIGCIGENIPTPHPFYTGPNLPLGTADSPGKPVFPRSLYLAQLVERLGPQALINIGYTTDGQSMYPEVTYSKLRLSQPRDVVDKLLGLDFAANKLANTSNVRNNDRAYGGERALDGNSNTYWMTNEGVTKASLEIDLEDPAEVNVVEIAEAAGLDQRVQSYRVEGMVDSDWKLLSEGTTISQRKLDRFPKVTVWKVRLMILKASDSPAISKFGFYLDIASPPAEAKSGQR